MASPGTLPRALLTLALVFATACGSSEDQPGTAAATLDGGSEATGPATIDAGLDRDASTPDTGAPRSPGDAPTDAADGGPPVDLGPGGDFRAYAAAAAGALQAFYSPSNGLFSTTGWWNSANALTALVDYTIATGDRSFAGDVATTFDANQAGGFLDSYYDDEGWWALAWIRAFDLTSDGRYLAMAKSIFADMNGGWDGTCGGGIWWSKARKYKNAIANELFLEVAVRLHLRTPGDAGAGSFLDWAEREWSWFDGSGMINAESLVNDGLASCRNNGGQTWTYNQGVLLGGLVDLASATNDASLLTRASAVAKAAMTKLVDGYGVLREPCEPSCGADGSQFKGIFMRHLAELWTATGDPAERVFLAANADWIWNADRDGQNQLGLTWSGAFDSADAARQSSALDALVAAVPFTEPEPNVALHMAATANGSCAPDQVAGKAFDGAVTTKWCSGSNSGDYWLDIDLGATALVSRIIVRHAGAGGENPAWNTRDFTLSLVDGAATSKVATVTGNTHDVTIHRFVPATARHVHLDITAPQTDPSTVAARIDELEVYAR